MNGRSVLATAQSIACCYFLTNLEGNLPGLSTILRSTE